MLDISAIIGYIERAKFSKMIFCITDSITLAELHCVFALYSPDDLYCGDFPLPGVEIEMFVSILNLATF